MTYVGYKSLKSFNKMRFLKTGGVVFKSTSLVYQFYLFFLYFTIVFLLLFFLCRKNIYDSSQFIRNILKWVFLKDMASRVEVLKS